MFCELHMSLSLSARAEDWGQQILRILHLLVCVPLLALQMYGNLHVSQCRYIVQHVSFLKCQFSDNHS